MSLLKMAISFEKRECQTRCEIEVRIQQGLPPDSNDFDFRNLEVTTSNVPVLSGACQADAVGFYYNALISYLEGFFQLMNKQYSWAIVKLYYAVYYCARAQMGFRKYAVIRHANDLYSIKMTVGEKAKRQRCRNDHNLIIGLYAEYFPSTYILSNKIDDVYYTEYMMNLREVTHYKQKAMKDPLWLEAFDELNKEIKSGKAVASVLNDCLSNLDSYCFDEKYAYLVTTFVMLKETAQMYKSQTCRMSTIQSKYIKQLLNKCKLTGYEAQLLS